MLNRQFFSKNVKYYFRHFHPCFHKREKLQCTQETVAHSVIQCVYLFKWEQSTSFSLGMHMNSRVTKQQFFLRYKVISMIKMLAKDCLLWIFFQKIGESYSNLQLLFRLYIMQSSHKGKTRTSYRHLIGKISCHCGNNASLNIHS